jgi:hypothetical protein
MSFVLCPSVAEVVDRGRGYLQKNIMAFGGSLRDLYLAIAL